MPFPFEAIYHFIGDAMTRAIIIAVLWLGSLVAVYFLTRASVKPIEKPVTITLPADTVEGPVRVQWKMKYVSDEAERQRLLALAEDYRMRLEEAERKYAEIGGERYFMYDTVLVRPVYISEGGVPYDTTHVIEEISLRVSQYPTPWLRLTTSESEFRLDFPKRLPAQEPAEDQPGFWSRFGFGPQFGIGAAAVIEQQQDGVTRVRYRPVPYLGLGIHYSF